MKTTIVLLAVCEPDNRVGFSRVLRRVLGVLEQRGP